LDDGITSFGAHAHAQPNRYTDTHTQTQTHTQTHTHRHIHTPRPASLQTYPHGIDEHASKTERDALGKVLAVLRSLKAVTKVNVHNRA
jgi:hypothetical protein